MAEPALLFPWPPTSQVLHAWQPVGNSTALRWATAAAAAAVASAAACDLLSAAQSGPACAAPSANVARFRLLRLLKTVIAAGTSACLPASLPACLPLPQPQQQWEVPQHVKCSVALNDPQPLNDHEAFGGDVEALSKTGRPQAPAAAMSLAVQSMLCESMPTAVAALRHGDRLGPSCQVRLHWCTYYTTNTCTLLVNLIALKGLDS